MGKRRLNRLETVAFRLAKLAGEFERVVDVYQYSDCVEVTGIEDGNLMYMYYNFDELESFQM